MITSCSYEHALLLEDDEAETRRLQYSTEGLSSFIQTFFNCVSLLLGLGMLACPYAVQKAGWSIFFIGLVCIPITYFYTAVLLKRCLERHADVQSFEDLSEKAYGRWGLTVFMTLFYLEIYATLVGYAVSIVDNLMEVVVWGDRWCWTGIVALVVLPTTWLRNLRTLSIMSMCSITSIAAVVGCLIWLVVSHSIEFSGSRLVAARPAWLPISTSIFLFNYSGHVVLPRIYLSMQDKSKFIKAITLSFSIATISYGGLGLLGALVFGDAIKSQVTLNLPSQHVASMVALWLTVLVPITKFGLMLSPLMVALERLLSSSSKTSFIARSCLALSVFLVSLVFPFFSYVLALIGATLSVSLCVICPCLFYIKVMEDTLTKLQRFICAGLIVLGAIVGATCTVFSIINYCVNHTTTTSTLGVSSTQS